MARQGAVRQRLRLEDLFFPSPPVFLGETHGSATVQREQLEPIFIKYGVNVVLSGHEHFYERVKAQKGIAYGA